MAQREEVIRRTVYVSEIDHQVKRILPFKNCDVYLLCIEQASFEDVGY